MSRLDCTRIRRKLGAFVDGELPGAEMLPIGQHLAACGPCAAHVSELRSVGDRLRAAVAEIPMRADDLGGLASGVVTRVRAERAASWMAGFSHAVEDWHWFFVGTGSLTATLTSAMLVSSLILSGPKPERDDSLAALLNNLATPAGTLFVVATPIGQQDRDSIVMQFDNGRTGGPARESATIPQRLGTPSDSELVEALDLSLTREGRFVSSRSMSPNDRYTADLILDELRRRALEPYQPARESAGLVVHRIELVANTSVTAKVLTP